MTEEKDQNHHALCPVHPHVCIRRLILEAAVAAILYCAVAAYTDASLPGTESVLVWTAGYVAMGVVLQATRVSYQSQLERVVGFALANKLWGVLQPL